VGAVAGAPPGQPPAPWRSLIDIRETRELHNQLAHEIRQRQQREGLVVVPWESVSFDKILDKGAFSTVAKAKLNMTPCAVKMNEVLSSHGVIEALALLDECSTMAIIHHPNIVKTLGIAFDAPAKIGLIMELMNCSLHELMHAHAFSFRELQRYVNWADSLLAIATDIAIGMTYLHYRHIIHRDLKPLNVLMTDGWTAKVADFGEVSLIKGARDAQHDAGVRAAPTNTWRSRFLSALASEASGGVSDLSSLDATEDQAGLKSAPQLVASKLTLRTDKSGVVRIHGTLSYLSPEAASVDIPTAPRVGSPTDVWSFGCLLAHCAARAPPYTDVKCQSAHEVIRQLRDGRAKPLSMVVEGDNMPALLMAIARECTCVAPEQRPTFAQISARLTDPNLIRVVCFEGMRMDEEDLDLDLDLDLDPDSDLEARRPPFNLSTPEKWTKEADCPKLSPGFTLKIPKSRFPGPKPPVVQPFPGPNPDFVKKGLHGIGIGFPEVCTDPEGDTEPRVGYVNSLVAHVQRIVGVHAATAGDTR
jgi:serine/threonine protein kinase